MSGKFCPVCERKNDSNATSCVYCCASLESVAPSNVSTTRQMPSDSMEFPENVEQNFIKSLAVPEQGIALYLMNNNKPIAICEDQEFIIGRKRSEIKKGVLVDLIPFGGNEYGVSQRHAAIRRSENHYEILDLDSTNGTVLNNKRIVPNKPYLLSSGSRIRLGLLILYAIYKDIPVG
jgi:pSer/pThr/pTyr-binding forkhead associated (FHA) protein